MNVKIDVTTCITQRLAFFKPVKTTVQHSSKSPCICKVNGITTIFKSKYIYIANKLKRIRDNLLKMPFNKNIPRAI